MKHAKIGMPVISQNSDYRVLATVVCAGHLCPSVRKVGRGIGRLLGY